MCGTTAVMTLLRELGELDPASYRKIVGILRERKPSAAKAPRVKKRGVARKRSATHGQR